MQKKNNIFLLLIILFLVNLFQGVHAQSISKELISADSLYAQKKYREAEKAYLQLLLEKQQYSPAMLLKIVQLNEMKASPHFVESLYALNLYYVQNPDNRILQRIQEIAEKQKLRGYDTTDLEYVVSFYNQHKRWIVSLIVLMFMGGIIYLYHRKSQGKKPIFRAIILTITMMLFFGIHNYILTYQKGILHQEALLMSAPSAGAKCLEVVSEGDCFQIIDKQDIWYKVRHKKDDLEGFIRQNNFLVVQ